MSEFRFWYDIMVNCAPIVIICGLLASLLSLFHALSVWAETDKISKTYLFIPVVIIILGFCYYIGMERLMFELK